MASTYKKEVEEGEGRVEEAAWFDKLFSGTEKLKSSWYGFLHIQPVAEHLFVIERSKKKIDSVNLLYRTAFCT